jgi:hypothetical protein
MLELLELRVPELTVLERLSVLELLTELNWLAVGLAPERVQISALSAQRALIRKSCAFLFWSFSLTGILFTRTFTAAFPRFLVKSFFAP